MTGSLEINGTTGNFLGLLVGNSDATGTSQVACGNGTTSLATIGATNASYSSPLVGSNQGFIYSQKGFYAITTDTDGFNWVQNGVNVGSIKNSTLTASNIDAAPIRIDLLTTKSVPTVSDELIIQDNAAGSRKKITIDSFPVSQPVQLNSIVNALIFG